MSGLLLSYSRWVGEYKHQAVGRDGFLIAYNIPVGVDIDLDVGRSICIEVKTITRFEFCKQA